MNHLEELQTLVLLGTDRAPVADSLLIFWQEQGLNNSELPEKIVAQALVFHRQWQRAGFPLPVWTAQLQPAPIQETEPECSVESARCLQDILDGKYPDALPEWIRRLQQAQQVLPRQTLPLLLQKCLQDPSLWETIQTAIGIRGTWLLKQHPEWRKLADEAAEPGAWNTTTGVLRPDLLRKLRIQDAALGRSLVQSTWAEEDPAQKAQLLAALSPGLGSADEAFLEECLQERRKETRQMAAELLACIPNSALLGRYRDYLHACIVVSGQKLSLELPDDAPEAWRKDGVEISGKSPFTLNQRSSWLFQLIRRLPPSDWQRYWGLSPETTISLFAQQDREESWVQALTDACLLHHDLSWQEALADWWLNNENASSWKTTAGRHLLQQLPEASLHKLMVPLLQKRQYLLEDDQAATFVLCANAHTWSDELTLALLHPFKRFLAGGENPFWNIWHYARLLKVLAYQCNPGLINQLNSDWTIEAALGQRWQAEIDRMLTVIQFRAKMIRTFSHIG